MDDTLLLKKKCYEILLGLLPNLFSIIAVFFMISISVKGLWFCVKMLEEARGLFVFAAIALCVIFLCLWVGILVLVTFSLKSIYKSAKVEVALNENSLRFTLPERNAIEIPKDQIECSWTSPAKLTILLEYQGKKFKFGFLRKFYSRSVLKEVETVMRTWGKYTEDRVLVRQKIKENSLNNLSSKNNFLTVL